MRQDRYWISAPAGRLAISARPRGGDWLTDEVKKWSRDGVDTVASLIEAEESRELDLEAEQSLAEEAGLSFISYPIRDRSVPGADAESIVVDLADRLSAGQTVLIHCRQGIGRAATIAVAVLVASGIPLQQAITEVSRARGVPIPETDEQRAWLEAFAPLREASSRI